MSEATQTDTAPVTTDTAPDGGSSSEQTTQTQTNGNGGDPAGGQQNDPAGSQQQNQPDNAQGNEFTLPDEYKDKPWAAKIKSQDDLFKQLDNAQTLIGKKTIQPLDYATATPEQIAEHHAKMAPESADAYDFGENADPEFSKAVGGIFKELGLNEYQGKHLAAKVNELAAQMVESQQAEAADGEKYLAALKETFGDKSQQVAVFLDNQIKQYASEKDVALLRDGIPNETRLALDRTIYNILQKHGVTESGAAAGDGGGAPAQDIGQVRADLRAQIRELGNKPHTAQEKQALIDKLNATYNK